MRYRLASFGRLLLLLGCFVLLPATFLHSICTNLIVCRPRRLASIYLFVQPPSIFFPRSFFRLTPANTRMSSVRFSWLGGDQGVRNLLWRFIYLRCAL